MSLNVNVIPEFVIKVIVIRRALSTATIPWRTGLEQHE